MLGLLQAKFDKEEQKNFDHEKLLKLERLKIQNLETHIAEQDSKLR